MGRIIGSIFLTIALLFGSVPAYATELAPSFVDDVDPATQAPSDDAASESLESTTNEEDVVNDGEGSEIIAPEEGSVVPEEGVAESESRSSDEASPQLFSVIGGAYIYQVDLEQKDDSTQVEVSLPNIEGLIASGRADEVVIEATMNYGDTITRQVIEKKDLSELASNEGSFILDFETYGKFSVSSKFNKAGSLVQSGDSQTMGVVADEYNIAPVSASLPVAFFSLSLWGDKNIRTNDKGGAIPTIMLMERPGAWNWDSLPESVYPLPYLSKEEIAYQPPDFGEASNLFRSRSAAMAEYVSDLYEMNPNANFNLYLVDFYLGLTQSILYANGIPQNQYTIRVLSDGAFSYKRFNEVYGGANPSSKHEELKSQWLKARDEAYATGRVSAGYSLYEPNAALYAAIDAEPNAQWWLVRPALLESKEDGNAFALSAQQNGKVVKINIASELADLQSYGSEAIEEFKNLYNFSDTYFSEAEDAGSKVMMFLGTTVGKEAGTFPSYAKFTQTFYGDEYTYYYKGHPGTPTEFYESKQNELESLGITDIDSSIAAELILFFYPDIYLSGYSSTTFSSVSNSEMAKGLFGRTKADALNEATYEVMDWFMSPITASAPEAIKALAKSDKSFLIEFADGYLSDKDYTLAIWDDNTSVINYYVLRNGVYEFVRSSGGDAGYDLRTITSKLDSSKVVDIVAASRDNGGNAQLYSNNRSLAQRYNLLDAGNGYFYIKNVLSGKVLDVAGAGTQNGTNVWQYELNKSDAQKWKIEPLEGEEGYFNIVSKLNNLCLDVYGASVQSGANIQVWERNGTDAQKFSLPKIEQVVSSGAHIINSAMPQAKNMVLDVSAASLADGGNVQIWTANQTKAQSFVLSFEESTGCYAISNENSEKVLDVESGAMWSGANVWQYAPNGTLAQKWTIEQTKNSDGKPCFTLYSATGSGAVLDVASAGTWNGANVQIWGSNGTDAQKWLID